MMMETVVYTREFLFVKENAREGRAGQAPVPARHAPAGHGGWPDYWHGLPPMHYATHAVSPLLALAKARRRVGRLLRLRAASARSTPSVRLARSRSRRALLKLRDSDLACEVTRSLFDTTRQYRESFDVYGDQAVVRVGAARGREARCSTPGFEDAVRVKVPDFAHLLPREIAPFTTHGVYDEEHEHTSFIQGGGHGGSHPHLAHEFIRAIVEERESFADARRAANWTMAGICAHESAMSGGRRVEVPAVR